VVGSNSYQRYKEIKKLTNDVNNATYFPVLEFFNLLKKVKIKNQLLEVKLGKIKLENSLVQN